MVNEKHKENLEVLKVITELKKEGQANNRDGLDCISEVSSMWEETQAD